MAAGCADCELQTRTKTQVAKALAPSIVYIGEIEKVLNTNKKLVKEWKK